MYPRLVTYGALALPSGSIALELSAGRRHRDPRRRFWSWILRRAPGLLARHHGLDRTGSEREHALREAASRSRQLQRTLVVPAGERGRIVRSLCSSTRDSRHLRGGGLRHQSRRYTITRRDQPNRLPEQLLLHGWLGIRRQVCFRWRLGGVCGARQRYARQLRSRRGPGTRCRCRAFRVPRA